MNDDSVVVSISCVTYNHEKYIRDCLEGFLTQKTSFTFEVLIYDDASTDGTALIIEEYTRLYPNIIKPILQSENQYSKGVRGMSRTFNYPRAKGQYIALCEGDDFWSDTSKLQKQVDFLKENPSFKFVCGGYIERFCETGEEKENLQKASKEDLIFEEGYEISFERLKREWLTKTLTVLFERDAINEYLSHAYKHNRDVHLFYHLMKAGRGFYYNNVFGVYRIHTGGIFSGESHKNNTLKHIELYKELYSKNTGDSFLRYKYFSCIVTGLKNGFVKKWPSLKIGLGLANTFSDYIILLKAILR